MQDFGVGHPGRLLGRRRCRWEDEAEIPSYNKSQQDAQFFRFI